MERSRKAQFEIKAMDSVSDAISIHTLSDIYSRDEHFAVTALVHPASYMEGGNDSTDARRVVYLRTEDAAHAIRFARKLANTFKAAKRAGSAQHGRVEAYTAFCANSPVRSYAGECAEAIARAFGWNGETVAADMIALVMALRARRGNASFGDTKAKLPPMFDKADIRELDSEDSEAILREIAAERAMEQGRERSILRAQYGEQE